jgi:serine/threonine protein kinase
MGQKKGDVLKTAFETYTIHGQIGVGGSGEVYEVRDSENATYAVKILDPAKASASRLKRFRNEIQFCMRNVHRNIIQVHSSGVTPGGATFYVMPRYSGTLRDLMKKGTGQDAVLGYFGQILDGVEAAHLQNVWHRDVKPENILVSGSSDTLVVADFGIAHFEEEELFTAVETKSNDRLANFLYSAPEQKIRGQSVDGKADVYALGLILNEMFTGAVPLGTFPPKVSDRAPALGYLDGLIEAMLSHDPNARPSVSDVKRDLIARGNEFLAVQRLSSLKSEVVPETEVDDPIIRNPIQLTGTDFREGHLVFKLSSVPPSSWIAAFQRPKRQWPSYMGAGPEYFTFRGNEAQVALRNGMSARQLQEYGESYIALANEQYADTVVAEHRKKLTQEREHLRRKIAEEERRQEILRQLKK